MCILNLIKRDFDYMCFDLNEILIEDNMFLRVYELKGKFRYLFHEDIKSKNVIRRVSSCIKEKFNGFHVALPSLSKIQKKYLTPIAIIYIPVKSQNKVIEFFLLKTLDTLLEELMAVAKRLDTQLQYTNVITALTFLFEKETSTNI